MPAGITQVTSCPGGGRIRAIFRLVAGTYMQTRYLFQLRPVRWGLYLGFWTCLGIFNVCQTYAQTRTTGRPFVWTDALVVGLADWYCWATLAPSVLALARRFPFEQSRWRRPLAFHFLASVGIGLLVALMAAIVIYLFDIGSAWSFPFERILMWIIIGPALVLYIWIYWAVLLVGHAWDYARKYRERELQASRLAGELARAQLHALKAQLHPHFLFNTLQSVSALMHQDVELADEMLVRLAELLRATLETAQTQEVPLRHELEFIETYLEIEQARLGDRLEVGIESDPEVWDALVPNLLLQPLVENAVRHGIAPRPEGGRLVVRAQRTAAGLELQIEDDGPGLPADVADGSRAGVGLANTRARLTALYGADHAMALDSGPEGGLRVVLRLPFREQADETAAVPVAGFSGGS